MQSRRIIRSKRFIKKQSLNPMESIVNLVDIMLIFACGLMVAIAARWGLDLNYSPEEGTGYESIGRVYVDPETNKTYIVAPAEEDASSSATSDTPGTIDQGSE